MSKQTFLVMAIVILASTAARSGASAAEEPKGWGQYRDRQLGLVFDFPAQTFSLKSAAQAQEGVAFSTPDGRARIRVFGFPNEANDTPAQYLRRVAKPDEAKFTYMRTAPRFFVASGTRNGMIFYRRCNFSAAEHRVSCLQIDYPQREKRAWDGIVTRISHSLRMAALD